MNEYSKFKDRRDPVIDQVIQVPPINRKQTMTTPLRNFLCSLYFGLLCAFSSIAQNPYESISKVGSVEDMDLYGSFPLSVEADILFYGFIHGGAIPQEIDAQIVIQSLQHGRRYYAPEVSPSQAFFINQYLEDGDENHLLRVISRYFAPQDASIEWIDKYRKIRQFNQTLSQESRLVVLGTDIESSMHLLSSHLAHLLQCNPCQDVMLDSLRAYKIPRDEGISILSGKPLWKLSQSTGHSFTDLMYLPDSQWHFFRRFLKYYTTNKEQVLLAFGGDQSEAEYLLEYAASYRLDMPYRQREEIITANFERLVLPLIKEGEKVYSNYGYAHVLQSSFQGRKYLAGRLKQSHPDLRIFSILTQMAEGEVLLERKMRKTGNKIDRYGTTLKEVVYDGYKTSPKWDGDTKKEKIRGLEYLKQITNAGQVRLVDVADIPSDHDRQRYFIDYEEGKNADNIQIDPTKKSSDYIQGIIYVEGSPPCVPYQEYHQK